MSERPPIDYDAIRADRARGFNDQQLAKKYGVADKTLRRTRARDAAAGRPWPECGAGADRAPDTATEAASASSEHETVVPDTSGQRATITVLQGGKSGSNRPGPTRSAIDFDVASVTDEQVARELLAAAYKGLRDFNAGSIEPGQHQSLADVLQSLAATASRAIVASRDVAGKKSGMPSGEQQITVDPVITIRHVRVAPADRKAG